MLDSNKKVHVKVTCDSESIRRVFIFNNIQYCILEKEGKVLEVEKVNDQKKCLSLIFEKTTWFFKPSLCIQIIWMLLKPIYDYPPISI